jgi:hypothetical protein
MNLNELQFSEYELQNTIADLKLKTETSLNHSTRQGK